MHEMLARLLAVAHDAQACIFLGLDPQQGCIGLGLAKRIALGPPLGPELVGFGQPGWLGQAAETNKLDRKSTRLNSSHLVISYAVFCLKKKTNIPDRSFTLTHIFILQFLSDQEA